MSARNPPPSIEPFFIFLMGIMWAFAGVMVALPYYDYGVFGPAGSFAAGLLTAPILAGACYALGLVAVYALSHLERF